MWPFAACVVKPWNQLSVIVKLSPGPSAPAVVAHENIPSLTPVHSLPTAVIELPSSHTQACVALRPSRTSCWMVALAPGLTLTTPLPLAPPKLLLIQLLRMTTFLARTWTPPLIFQPSITSPSLAATYP